MPERENLQFLAPVTTHQQEQESEDVAEDEVEEGPEHNQPGWPLSHRAQAISLQVGAALTQFPHPTGGEGGYRLLQKALANKGTDVQVAEVPDSGHYIPEEQPETVIQHAILHPTRRDHPAAVGRKTSPSRWPTSASPTYSPAATGSVDSTEGYLVQAMPCLTPHCP
jgi:hypothetical protein